MAATKLTLRMDEEVIERGKLYARKQGTSLSRLIEQFLREKAPPAPKPYIVIEPDPEILALMLPNRSGRSYAGSTKEQDEYFDYVSSNHLNSEEE